MERKSFPFEVKQVEGDSPTVLVGYASVYGIVDNQGEVIDSGAFAKSIRERVPAKRVPLIADHDWTTRGVLGSVVEAMEDTRGLLIKAEFSKSSSVQEVVEKVREGHIKGLSVGFSTIRDRWDDGIRHITEAILYEVSLTPFPANEEAIVIGLKTVVPFQDWPLASRDRRWDANAAISRLRRFSGSEEEPSSDYKKFFIWYDRENPDQFGSYKLPICDIVDGEVKAIPRAIFAAAAAVQGARGGVDIPENDIPGVRRHLERYYRKMATEFDDDTIVPPWAKGARSELQPEPPPRSIPELVVRTGKPRVILSVWETFLTLEEKNEH